MKDNPIGNILLISIKLTKFLYLFCLLFCFFFLYFISNILLYKQFYPFFVYFIFFVFVYVFKYFYSSSEKKNFSVRMADIEDLKPKEIPPVMDEENKGTELESCDLNKTPQIDEDLKKEYIVNEKLDNENRNLSTLSTLNGGIPGSHSVYVKTWGCSHNWSDSEYMAGILIKNGYRVTFKDDESVDANIWVLNSCTVKGRAQNLFESALKKAKSLSKYVVTAGCVPSGDKKNELWKDVSIIGVQQIDQINYVVQQTLNGNVVQLLKNKKVSNDDSKRKAGGAPLSMPKLRRNNYEEIVPINTGCLNQVYSISILLIIDNLNDYFLHSVLIVKRNMHEAIWVLMRYKKLWIELKKC